MLCPRCSNWTDDQAQFCANCGCPLTPARMGGAPPMAGVWGPPTLGYAVASDAVEYAGFWRRFAAMIIDNVVILVVEVIIGIFLGIVLIIVGGASEATIQTLGFVLGVIADWLYHALFESSGLRASPGKLAIGMVVTDIRSPRISFGQATVRHFAKILSGLTLGVGFLMAGFTERKQALHDSIAECLVVMKR